MAVLLAHNISTFLDHAGLSAEDFEMDPKEFITWNPVQEAIKDKWADQDVRELIVRGWYSPGQLQKEVLDEAGKLLYITSYHAPLELADSHIVKVKPKDIADAIVFAVFGHGWDSVGQQEYQLRHVLCENLNEAVTWAKIELKLPA